MECDEVYFSMWHVRHLYIFTASKPSKLQTSPCLQIALQQYFFIFALYHANTTTATNPSCGSSSSFQLNILFLFRRVFVQFNLLYTSSLQSSLTIQQVRKMDSSKISVVTVDLWYIIYTMNFKIGLELLITSHKNYLIPKCCYL